MASKYIDNATYATSGYTLSGVFQSLTIGAMGTIGGPGLSSSDRYAIFTILNRGTVSGTSSGIDTTSGAITNSAGALIEGTVGISGLGLAVQNSGTIEGRATQGSIGVSADSGTITNLAGGLILAAGMGGEGVFTFGESTISNAGTIEALNSGDGLGGLYADIINAGLIIGGASGILENDCVINNAAGGTIIGQTGTGVTAEDRNFGGTNAGIIEAPTFGVLDDAGYFGEFTNTGTLLASGKGGVAFEETSRDEGGSLTNSGMILSLGAGGMGIVTDGNWVVQNTGSAALVQGSIGANLAGGVGNNLVNSGIIIGTGPAGAGVEASGLVLNSGTIIATGSAGTGIKLGSAGTIVNETAGLVDGATGIAVTNNGPIGTISNFGTIIGSGHRSINGTGVYLSDGGTLANIGTAALIEGYWGVVARGLAANVTNGGRIEATGKYGAALGSGGTLVNTASGVIAGGIGAALYGRGTITNYGTIASSAGASGIAVKLNAASEVLVDEAGSVLIGVVEGGGGTLALAGSGASLSGLGSQFLGFSTLSVLAGTTATLDGTNAVDGKLTAAGSGTLDIAGTLSGAGALTLAGTETIATSGVLTVAQLTQSGGSLTLAKDTTYRGGFVQTGGKISVSGHTLVLDGVGILAGGAVNGSGFLATYGTIALVTYTADAGAVWQVYGTVDAVGSLTLGNAGGGSGRLAVEAGGIFDITSAGGVAVAPGGGATLINYGLFEKTGGTGISIVAPAITNNGVIDAASGALDFAGAIAGAGAATIGSAGALRFDGAVSAGQTIAFAGTAGGRLVLDDPAGSGLGFAGAVSGFGGKDQIDLPTLAYTGSPTLAWSQHGASGTLSITDGSKLAQVTLFGQYMQSGFGTAEETGGGTVITYTPATAQTVVLAGAHRG